MNKKQNIKPLKELSLTDRFLFDEVMEDWETHRTVLSIILGREIPLLEQSETEKEFRKSPKFRSIKMDVFAKDEENKVYNTEMQQKQKNDLEKRSRYYQALMDTTLLKPGIPTYNLLNDSYIIMITPFDIFGYDRYVYTFRARCEEEPECILKDGAVRIFLNTRGKNDDEVSEELVEFLHYAENTLMEPEYEIKSERIRRIHSRVCEVKVSEEVGVKYMQAWEEKIFEREEARAEGKAEGKAEQLVGIIRKKCAKHMESKVIAEFLELEEDYVARIVTLLQANPDADDWEIAKKLLLF